MSREGIMTCGKPIILTAENLQLKPYVICTDPVAHVLQIKKTMLQRALRGYRIVRKTGGKVYKSEKTGLLQMLEAKNLGKGVIMVPQRNAEAIEKLFTQHYIKHTKTKVWC
jgi:hypothetical protein